MYDKIPAQTIKGADTIKNIRLKSCRPMFKSCNLHLRNRHSKHLKHAYTLMECGVEHNLKAKLIAYSVCLSFFARYM